MNSVMDKREEFILSFWKYAYGLAYKYGRGTDVDDLAQEALLAVVSITSCVHAADKSEAYIHTAMIHAIYTYLNNSRLIKPEFAVRHRHTSDEMVIDVLPLSPIDEDTIEDTRNERSEDWQWLYDLIGALPSVQRTVVGYSFGLEGYGKIPMSEIAQRLGFSSMGTISGAKERALKNLRKHLDPDFQRRMRRNEQLRAARIEHGWTTKQVGSLLHMSTPRNYECWEREGMRPSEETIAKLCNLFGATPQDLGFSAEEKK